MDDVQRLESELANAREACHMMARIVISQQCAMQAARIEMCQNGPHEGMQWILNSLPDVWDTPETEWDDKESAQEWFDRADAWYRAGESDG